jgi:protein tyrosine phosphatase (PTP) superfamily phosphohydrolase (DUF442 family)
MHHLSALLDRHALAIGLLLLGAAAIAPVYVYLHYPAAGDPEYPQFTTVIYSPSPPAAYRIVCEDGFVENTTAFCHGVICVAGLLRIVRMRRAGREPAWWPLLVAFHFFCWWRELGPEPELWTLHAFSWKYLAQDSFPWQIRLTYGAMSLSIVAAVLTYTVCYWRRLRELGRGAWRGAANQLWLLGFALLLVAQAWDDRVPGLARPDPPQYAEEWLEALAGLAFLLSALERRRRERRAELAGIDRPLRYLPADLTAGLVCLLIVWNGTNFVQWCRAPLYHFGVAWPDTLYRSGQPRYRDLWLAQKYYGFRTIVNLHGEGRSPYWPEEERFAREHGIRIVWCEGDARRFVDVVADSRNWPVLVHCRTGFHRTTAMVGCFRAACLGWSADAIFREIEQISGRPTKPKFVEQLSQSLPRLSPAMYPGGRFELPPARMAIRPDGERVRAVR